MKRIFCTLIAIACATAAFPQKIKVSGVDEITNAFTVTTDYNTIINKAKLTIDVASHKVGNRRYVSLAIATNKPITIQAGSITKLTLSNDETIIITSTETNSSRRGGLEHGKATATDKMGVNVTYLVREADYAKLIANKVKKLSITTISSYLEDELSNAGGERLLRTLILTK